MKRWTWKEWTRKEREYWFQRLWNLFSILGLLALTLGIGGAILLFQGTVGVILLILGGICIIGATISAFIAMSIEPSIFRPD